MHATSNTPESIPLPRPFGTNIAALPDGSLVSCHAAAHDDVARGGLYGVELDKQRPEQPVFTLWSEDNGRSWSEPRQVFAYPPGKGIVPAGGYALADMSGALHVFNIRYFSLREPWLSHLLHHVSRDGGKTWSNCQRIDFGADYTGALNSVIQLASGRILLALSFLHPERKADRFAAICVFSDDQGETWNQSNELNVRSDIAHLESGAIEPVMTMLRNGLVWMVIRTTTGYLWESFSSDGHHWPQPIRTRVISSNSPAGVLRLRGERLALFWNNLYGEPFHRGASYARQILFGAISGDDGQTWSAPKAVARRRDQEGNKTQVCYPYPCQAADDSILLLYNRINPGQGANTHMREMIRLNADWLAGATQ